MLTVYQVEAEALDYVVRTAVQQKVNPSSQLRACNSFSWERYITRIYPYPHSVKLNPTNISNGYKGSTRSLIIDIIIRFDNIVTLLPDKELPSIVPWRS